MNCKFPVPQNDAELCKLIKYVEIRRKEIKIDVEKLINSGSFNNNHNNNPTANLTTDKIPMIIAYMEYFNQKD